MPSLDRADPCMPSLSRDEVAHLAGLARIDLSDAELDHLAGQLAVILESVAPVAEVAADDIPPTSHAAAADQRLPRRRRRARPDAEQALAGAPAVEEQRFRVPADPGGGGVMSDLTRLHGRRGSPRPLAAGETTRGRGRPGPTWTGSPRSTAPCTPSCTSTPRARWPAAAAVDARRAAGEPLRPLAGVPDRGQGRAGHAGAADDVRVADPRGLGAAVRRDGRRAAQGRRPGDPRQDQHGRVRDGLLDRALGLRPDPQPVGPRPDPRRLRRRLGGGGRRLRGAARASAPTPAARSASRRRSPAPSA